MVGAKRQKLVIGVAAALMMLLGASLAWAGGLTVSSGGSLPTIVASDRPVAAAADTAPVEVKASENTTKAPRIAAKRASATVTKKTNASSVVVRKKSSATSSSKKNDERETVKPPVRDEDDDDDDDDDEHDSKKSNDSSHGD